MRQNNFARRSRRRWSCASRGSQRRLLLSARGGCLCRGRSFHEGQGIGVHESVVTLLGPDMNKIVEAVKNLHLLPAFESRADLQRGHGAVEIDEAVLLGARDYAELLGPANSRHQKKQNDREHFCATFHFSPTDLHCVQLYPIAKNGWRQWTAGALVYKEIRVSGGNGRWMAGRYAGRAHVLHAGALCGMLPRVSEGKLNDKENGYGDCIAGLGRGDGSRASSRRNGRTRHGDSRRSVD